MYSVEPKKTRTKFTINVKKDKDNPTRLPKFRKELEALLKKHRVKKTR
jgi:hypothetical protein